MYDQLQKPSIRLAFAVVFGLSAWVVTANAQTYIEPSSSTGGATATPLNGSTSTQRKLGSLIIGPSGGSSKFCLNTSPDANGQPVAGDTNCIAAWNQVGGHFVRLWTDTNTGFGGFTSTSTNYDAGYVRLKAQDSPSSPQQPITAIFEGSNVPGSAAIWAAAGNYTPPSTTWAGYFEGNTAVLQDLGGNPAKLCLNGINTLDGSGVGCITSWSQIQGLVPPAGNYVNLQNMNNPSSVAVQNGGASISGSANLAVSSGGVVVGIPTAFTPCVNNGTQCVPVSCGDGICSASGGETSTNCAQDCALKYTVTVNMTGQTSHAGVFADGGISCGSAYNPQVCSAQYPAGTVLTIGDPIDIQSGYRIIWGGDCAGTPNSFPCTVTVNKDINAAITVASTTGGCSGFNCSGGCFVAGTRILTPLGARAIQDIAVGDTVYAYDETNGRQTTSQVTETFVHQGRSFGRVVFSDGSSIQTTAYHPFYDPVHHVWKDIGTMQPGDVVLKHGFGSHRWARILTLEFSSGLGTVYNLEVSGYHTYYANDTVVHNKVIGGGGAGG
ncbi:MAG: hypothetical protein HY976_03865 [Candidatus Kerfeldbacteria bacterium]|nr:hypothetical protein [Candidatus Kerfeldbacteria bacterium]